MRLALMIAAAIAIASTATAKDDGRWANAPEQLKKWFREQVSPKTKERCCDDADGRYAEDTVSPDGRLLARWDEVAPEWVEVPQDVIITGPNPTGHPVVWTYRENGKIKIRCYAKGIQG